MKYDYNNDSGKTKKKSTLHNTGRVVYFSKDNGVANCGGLNYIVCMHQVLKYSNDALRSRYVVSPAQNKDNTLVTFSAFPCTSYIA